MLVFDIAKAHGVAKVLLDEAPTAALHAVMHVDPVLLIAVAITALVLVFYKMTDGFKNWTPMIAANMVSLHHEILAGR